MKRWRERAAQASSLLIDDGATDDVTVSAVAEPDDVDQVLDVLIDNALIHAPGRVEVSSMANGEQATLSVRDRGPGMPG